MSLPSLLVTLFVNKLANIVIWTYFQFIQMPIAEANLVEFAS